MRFRFVLAIAAFLLAGAPAAEAKVFYSRSEALGLAFPDADRVEKKIFFLREEEAQRVEKLSGAKVRSKLVAFHVGFKEDKALGYAIIDTHVVRTQPETFLVVLSPEGAVRRLQVLAFYEPREYLPSERWLRQFDRKILKHKLRLRKEIHGIAGATLSAHAVTKSVRKALALYEVLIKKSGE